MILRVCTFTKKGEELAKRIEDSNPDIVFEYRKKENSLEEWTRDCFSNHLPVLFIGACGIAVRTIAPFIEDKLTDSAVVVVDERGQFVIPILSGHMGGANELAIILADSIGAKSVITTATDIEGSFSVDLFAKENNLAIHNRDGIAKVSGSALEGKAIRLCIENYPPTEKMDVCVSSDIEVLKQGVIGLCPRQYALGIGCRKDTSFSQIKEFLLETLEQYEISINQVGAIASIDLKKDELGIIALSNELHIPFITYTKELLSEARGEYEESEFVRETTGVGNVCERAAMLLTGNQGEFVFRKVARDGVTLALVKAGN